MSLKPFDPNSKRTRGISDFDMLFFRLWDDTNNSWTFWHYTGPTDNPVYNVARDVFEVANNPMWKQITQREYNQAVLEYDRKARIQAQGGVPKFKTAEEAEAWLDAQ